ncbi:MAG: sucrase ferredoxin [Kineosporiaceae bacterium]
MDAVTLPADAPAPCSVSALVEPLPGTAPARAVWALIEHAGPWGRDAVLDAPWPAQPEGFAARLAQATDDAGVRVVLARRFRSRHDGVPARPLVVLSRVGPGGWTAARRLREPAELLDLDWAGLTEAAFAPGGWDDAGPLWGVCTHGTRDACCARLGRPLAEALSALDPDHTWEISHSGGHRFAGTVTTWPEGMAYGRVTPDHVDRLVATRRRGEVAIDLARGRCDLSPADQAGELAVRAALGEARLSALVAEPALDAIVRDGATVLSRWRHRPGDGSAETVWQVELTRTELPEHPASCGKGPEPAWAWLPGPVLRVH